MAARRGERGMATAREVQALQKAWPPPDVPEHPKGEPKTAATAEANDRS